MTLRVDWRASVSLVGTVTKYLAATMLVPLLVAFVYREAVWVFVISILVTLGIGVALERVDPAPDLGVREALLLVSLVWFVASAVGTIPFLLAGNGIPLVMAPTTPASTLGHPVNALFESMSGFTTTGATVMGEISLERHSHAIMMWRQESQWLGGMGIIVLMIAIHPTRNKLLIGGRFLPRWPSLRP